jgi:hypothetical protein
MPSEGKLGPKHVPVFLALAGFVVLVLLVLRNALGLGLSLGAVLYYLLVVLAGYAIFLIGMPFFFWIIGEAGYRTFLKPYVRALHIRRIRNQRLLDEAAARGFPDAP